MTVKQAVGTVWSWVASDSGPDEVSEGNATVGVRGTPDPEGGWDNYGSETPPGPAASPIDRTIDADTLMQPPDDAADHRAPPVSLEEAVADGNVDPYAIWTDDHVDDGLVGGGTIIEEDNTLIDPPEILAEGPTNPDTHDHLEQGEDPTDLNT